MGALATAVAAAPTNATALSPHIINLAGQSFSESANVTIPSNKPHVIVQGPCTIDFPNDGSLDASEYNIALDGVGQMCKQVTTRFGGKGFGSFNSDQVFEDCEATGNRGSFLSAFGNVDNLRVTRPTCKTPAFGTGISMLTIRASENGSVTATGVVIEDPDFDSGDDVEGHYGIELKYVIGVEIHTNTGVRKLTGGECLISLPESDDAHIHGINMDLGLHAWCGVEIANANNVIVEDCDIEGNGPEYSSTAGPKQYASTTNTTSNNPIFRNNRVQALRTLMEGGSGRSVGAQVYENCVPFGFGSGSGQVLLEFDEQGGVDATKSIHDNGADQCVIPSNKVFPMSGVVIS